MHEQMFLHRLYTCAHVLHAHMCLECLFLYVSILFQELANQKARQGMAEREIELLVIFTAQKHAVGQRGGGDFSECETNSEREKGLQYRRGIIGMTVCYC